MEFWILLLIFAAALSGAVLALLVARENYRYATRLMTMIPQRVLLRAGRELLAGTILLLVSVGGSLTLLAYERDQRLDAERELKQLRASVHESAVALRVDAPPVEVEPLEEIAPVVPVPIQDREDLAFVDAEPEGPRPTLTASTLDRALRVAVPNLNLRNTPNGSVIRNLRRGHRVRLVRELVVDNERWALVRSLENDVEGWVSRSLIAGQKSQG